MNILNVIKSNDSTKKYFFDTVDGCDNHIEACLLNLERHGHIICISSQIGCSRKCLFCAAGHKKFLRNLYVEEIIDQVKLIVDDNYALKNENFQITYMGSGEPFENIDNVFESIDYFRTKYSNLQKINISTIFPKSICEKSHLIKWEKYKDFLHFQFSMHFSNDYDRRKYFQSELPSILESINCLNNISYQINDTYRINYILFDGINDGIKQIYELNNIMNKTNNAVLKISQMCAISDSPLKPSNKFAIFVNELKKYNYQYEIFQSDGTDINAGCGQFYNDSII